MKNIPVKQSNFQNLYASRFTKVLFFAVAIEIYILVMVILGGGK